MHRNGKKAIIAWPSHILGICTKEEDADDEIVVLSRVCTIFSAHMIERRSSSHNTQACQPITWLATISIFRSFATTMQVICLIYSSLLIKTPYRVQRVFAHSLQSIDPMDSSVRACPTAGIPFQAISRLAILAALGWQRLRRIRDGSNTATWNYFVAIASDFHGMRYSQMMILRSHFIYVPFILDACMHACACAGVRVCYFPNLRCVFFCVSLYLLLSAREKTAIDRFW